MTNPKLSVKKGIIFIPLIAGVCAFCAGFFWLISQADNQMQIKKSKSLAAKALVNQQDAVLKTQAMINSHIFEVPPQFQGQTVGQVKLNEQNKVIALTFDDGPAPKYTEQILHILKQNNIKATFFCVGEMVHYFPVIAKLEVSDGHAIGNHTWHHWYHWMNPSTAKLEIESTATQMYETMGVKTSLFRPPFGSLSNGVADYAKKNNYAILMWSDDSQDYRRPPVSKLIDNVLRGAKPGGMVLMHDGGGNRANTVKALPEIINALRKRGYRFVTVPELLEIQR
ncbi:polysaccharide deacetylase family protein [Nostoc sp. TCL26-01]|uniref:polysaccharide deacetylase family protein n=1 Tax=Nostoc sp. TCL26-01 TaxID=2576904 RepID=UPI0015BAF82B|nr:polysaccharide deacetylase family protein [Nostoc sp. TCL26-01]QLE56288.1 polysaccharide deacetylase family protein [Nostoc sp. TCL26-01]